MDVLGDIIQDQLKHLSRFAKIFFREFAIGDVMNRPNDSDNLVLGVGIAGLVQNHVSRVPVMERNPLFIGSDRHGAQQFVIIGIDKLARSDGGQLQLIRL